jgi:ketosteroid isomerase-like protein
MRVSIPDVSDPNVELVRETLNRFNSGDHEAIFELVSEDFVSEVPPSMSAEPDTYEGHDGVRRYLQAFEGLIDDVRFEPLGFEAEGEVVIVDLVLKGRGSASGIAVEQRAAVAAWIDGGKVARMQPYPDVESARAALRPAR